MAGRLGAGLVEMLARRARELQLPGRLQADGAVRTGQRDDMAVLDDRLPAIGGELVQQVADAAGLLVRGRAMVGAASRGFSPLANTARRSSRFSIRRSALPPMSVRVVIGAPLAGAASARQRVSIRHP